MVRVSWTARAIDDLAEIRHFIAQDSARAAEVHIRRLVVATRRLKDFPFSGRPVLSRRVRNVREIILGNYRIIYRVASDEEVEVLTVVHGARLFGSF